MNDRRYVLGVLASLAWFVAAGLLIWFKQSELSAMSPNAWGDFFAGCFAPLAFLWLVLGYLQQGEELRLSTEALRLQADELKNSVEQQRALVEVSRQQVEYEREKFREERHRQLMIAKPNIIVESDGGSFRGDGQSTYPIILSNAGNIAVNLFVTLRHQLGRIDTLHKAAAFERGATHQSRVEVASPQLIEGSILELNFGDQLGNQFSSKYLITRQSDHQHSSLKLSRIES